MRRRTRQRRCDAAVEVASSFWMISFSDLLTLLIAFFVMRLSMSSLENISIEKLLGRSGESLSKEEAAQERLTTVYTKELRRVLGQPDEENRKGEEEARTLDLSVEKSGNGTVIRFGGQMFISGSDELSPGTLEVLGTLAKTVAPLDAQIKIAGHTDNVPISTFRFPSNWELSTARAIAVARELTERGISGERISVVGYADQKPKGENDSLEGREQNRRVEIYVIPNLRQ